MAIGRIPEPGTGIPESIIAAKGDLLTGTANDTPAVLTAGANETRLVTDSAAATGLKYVADTTNYAVAAKGDLLVGTAADTVAPLTVGANGTTLVADSGEATGLKWAAPAGGGKVLQVVQGTLTSDVSTTSGSFTDSGLSVSITPSLATSKVLVFVNFKGGTAHTGTQSSNLSVYGLIRTSTQLQGITYGIDKYSATAGAFYQGVSFSYLDSPATTSATTYKVQFLAASANTTVFLFATATQIASIVAMEIGA